MNRDWTKAGCLLLLLTLLAVGATGAGIITDTLGFVDVP
jgi:hypothetical protein